MGGFTSDNAPARRHWLFNLTSVGIESFGCCETEIWKDAVYLFSALSTRLRDLTVVWFMQSHQSNLLVGSC